MDQFQGRIPFGVFTTPPSGSACGRNVTMTVERGEFIPARPSQSLVEKIRDLAHEATRRGEASELITAALELCVEYEIAVRVANNVGEKIEEISMMIGSYV